MVFFVIGDIDYILFLIPGNTICTYIYLLLLKKKKGTKKRK